MKSTTTKDSLRNKYLVKTYGITQAIYLVMFKVNFGRCWICNKEPRAGKNLHVDHEHSKSKRVRGLLCWYCNKKIIGRFKLGDEWKFRAAAAYLESRKDWRRA